MMSNHIWGITREIQHLTRLEIFNHEFQWVVNFTGFAFQRHRLKVRVEWCQKLIDECQEILNGKENIPLEEDVPAFGQQIQKAWIVGKMGILIRSKERMDQALLAFPEVLQDKQRITKNSKKLHTDIPTVPSKTFFKLPPEMYGLIGDFLLFSERHSASRTCKVFHSLADKALSEIIYDKSGKITPLYIHNPVLDCVFVMEAIFRKLENATLSRYELFLAIKISKMYFKKSETFRRHDNDSFFCAEAIAVEAGKYLVQEKQKSLLAAT